MIADDRLLDLLRAISGAYYEAAKALAETPDGDDYRSTRASLTVRMATLVECADPLAEAIGVAVPLWDDMRGLAGLPW